MQTRAVFMSENRVAHFNIVGGRTTDPKLIKVYNNVQFHGRLYLTELQALSSGV